MNTFELQNPTSVADASKLLPSDPGDRSAVLLAGGQDLLTEMKERLVEPERLVNLKGIAGLDSIDHGADGSVTVGALVTLEALEEDAVLNERFTVLAEAASVVASPQIRSVGTLGGNLNQRPRCWYYRHSDAPCLKKGGSECFAYAGRSKYNAILGGGPSYIVHPSDVAPALVALGAEVTLVGPGGERKLPIEDYYTLPAEGDVLTETVRAPGEVLTHVHVPAPAAGTTSTYLKFRERESYDWALASVAVSLRRGDDGAITDARMALGGVAPKPWRALAAEQALQGKQPGQETWKVVAAAATRGAQPLGENAYKVPLTQGIVTRALQALTQ